MATSSVAQISLRQFFGIVTLIGLILIPSAYGAFGLTWIPILILAIALLLWYGHVNIVLLAIGLSIVVGMVVWVSNVAVPAPKRIGSDSNDPFIQQIIRNRESASRKIPPP